MNLIDWLLFIAVSMLPPSTLWKGLLQWWMGVRPGPDTQPSDVIAVRDWRWVGAALDIGKGMGLYWLLPSFGLEGQAIVLGIAVVLGAWIGRLSILGTARVVVGIMLLHQPWSLAIMGIAYPVMSMILNRLTWGWVGAVAVAWLFTQDSVVGLLLIGSVVASWGRMMETLGPEGRWWWQFERRA